jgi:hypothetical protein
MRLPWQPSGQVDRNHEYLALLTYLPLKHFRALPRFLWYTLQIQRQLREAPGLIGYSLEAKLFRKRFWTLSAWESEDVLQAFVAREPHAVAMRGLAVYMEATAFYRWRVAGSDLPLSWAEAHERERGARVG